MGYHKPWVFGLDRDLSQDGVLLPRNCHAGVDAAQPGDAWNQDYRYVVAGVLYPNSSTLWLTTHDAYVYHMWCSHVMHLLIRRYSIIC